MTDENLDRVHCDDLEDSDATLCGILFASILRVTAEEDDVDCPDCLRILNK